MTTNHPGSESRSSSPLPRLAWVVVAMLWIVALLNYLDRQLIITMGTPIKADLGISDAHFGLFSSVFLWIYAILSPIAGYVADRFGKRRIIIASLLVWSAVTWMTGHVRSFEEMLVARALMGISEAFYIPAAVALIVDYHRGSTRSRATGLHLSGAYAGAISGGLGGWLSENWGWRDGFTLFGAVGVGYALVLMAFLKNPPEEDETDQPASGIPASPPEPLRIGPTFAALFSSSRFLLLLGAWASLGAASWGIRNWLPLFFENERGVTATQAGIYGTSFINIASFFGMLAGGTISDWWSRRLPRARALVPGIALTLAAPCFLGLISAPWIGTVIAALMVMGVAQGTLDSNLMPTLCLVANPRHRATGYGLLNLLSTMTGGAMTYLVGFLKDHQVSLNTSFQFAAILILMAGVFLLQVKPAQRAQEG